MAGRRPKYHPERIEAILQSLRNGAPREAAAGAAGISRSTFYEWLQDRTLSEAVERAEDEFVTRNVAIIERAAETQWQAAAWLLERRRHEQFGRRDKVDMAVDVRSLALKIAADQELDADSVIAEAELILARG